MLRSDILFLFILMYPRYSVAQIVGTVIDMESHTPMKGVEVIVNGRYADKVVTDYTGRFTVAGDVKELTFIRQGYESLLLKKAELKDTIELLPSYNRVGEVIVYGKMPGKHIPMMAQLTKELKEMVLVPKGNQVASGDFLGWLRVFEKGYVSAKKRKERMKAIENY